MKRYSYKVTPKPFTVTLYAVNKKEGRETVKKEYGLFGEYMYADISAGRREYDKDMSRDKNR